LVGIGTGGSIIYALAFCAFNGKWKMCWRSTCLKIENGGGEGNTVAIVHVVRGQATIQSNRKAAKQQQSQNKYEKKENR